PAVTLEEARKLLEVVIGPEDLVAKVSEFKFANKEAPLAANGLKSLPPLPSMEKLQAAKEQKKALIFRIGRDGEGKEVNLAHLKERFGVLIYSSWYLNPPAPFALEPLTAGWALVDLDPLPGSTEKTFEEQQAFAQEKNTRLKSPAADAYDLLVAYKVTGKFFRDCPLNGRTATIVAKEPVKISHFDKAGMCISTGWGPTVKNAEIGATTELILS
ncbi:MAG: hypothetical protein L0Y56_16710, partial [Nitrospira sp.]|nr:hypothetical protein [Nitrospira sp.]